MKKAIRSLVKELPLLAAACTAYAAYRRSKMSTEEIFTEIFKQNAWEGTHSISGSGSDPDQTDNLIEKLPVLLRELQVSTMLDIPCGDFHWMRKLDLKRLGVSYIGADIVRELVSLIKKYEADNIAFVHANLLTDQLPNADLVLCRDCLVHLSFADLRLALQNICRSGATYLLTTTFTEVRENIDIATGGWRALNLEIEPFNFPAPLSIIVEDCTEENGKFRDKSLGLWMVGSIEKCVIQE